MQTKRHCRVMKLSCAPVFVIFRGVGGIPVGDRIENRKFQIPISGLLALVSRVGVIRSWCHDQHRVYLSTRLGVTRVSHDVLWDSGFLLQPNRILFGVNIKVLVDPSGFATSMTVK